jgi:hypothetical protein
MTTTITCPIPSSINPLSPNGFLFSIQKLPQLNFFCQQVNLPGVILGEPEFSNPLSRQPIPGETITYDTLNVQFLIDEQMLNYKAIYNWILALGFPTGHELYTDFLNNDDRAVTSELAKNFSDATLQILGSNNTAIQTVTFTDVFPVNLSTLTFQSTNQDVNYLVGDVSFRYGYYTFANQI